MSNALLVPWLLCCSLALLTATPTASNAHRDPLRLPAIVVSDCTESGLDAALAQGGAISFACGSSPVTITLTSQKTIAIPTSLDGGAARVILTGSSGPGGFFVPAGSTFAAYRLTFAGGVTMVNHGEVRLRQSVLRSVTGIENRSQARLTVEGSMFVGTVRGLVNEGVATVRSSTFDGNTQGIWNGSTGVVLVTGSRFVNHRTLFAMSNHGGRLSIHNSLFTDNGSSRAFFSASLYIEGGTVSIHRTLFRQNHSRLFGGAISIGQATVRIADSTFVRNRSGRGGALDCFSVCSLTIVHSTFVKNRATWLGGALRVFGALRITNSTLLGNSAGDTGGAVWWTASGFPGGDNLRILNSTFVDNTAGSAAGALDVRTDGAQVSNTIMVGSTAASLCAGHLTGRHNLQWPPGSPACGAEFRFADPLLGPLAPNGGSTLTLALRPGSPAIDAVPATSPCPATDQRHLPRPIDGDHNGSVRCDIGALEAP